MIDTLYHYTNQAGFMGIFLSETLWASKIQYLNDEKEYNWAIELAELELKKRISKTKKENTKTRLEYYLSIVDNIRRINTCVCSLSENGDLLSQWRGYSSSHGGYSIGFNFQNLKNLLDNHDYQLVKCIYNEGAQKKLISNLIKRVVLDHIHEDEISWDYKMEPHYDSGEKFLDELSRLAPTIKHPSFSEEAEWRIIVTVDFDHLEFRPGKSSLTPYIALKIGSSKRTQFLQLIDEVIVGHTPHQDLAIDATEAFLIKKYPPVDDNYQCQIPVKGSKIPYRNW